MHHISSEFFGKTSNHPGDSAPIRPRFGAYDFWLFPKLKSPLKGKKFQTINEIQENTPGSWWWLGELCEVPRCLLWRGLRHLSYVQCFLYLVSSINVSNFHITWLHAFWTDLVCFFMEMSHLVCCNFNVSQLVCGCYIAKTSTIVKFKYIALFSSPILELCHVVSTYICPNLFLSCHRWPVIKIFNSFPTQICLFSYNCKHVSLVGTSNFFLISYRSLQSCCTFAFLFYFRILCQIFPIFFFAENILNYFTDALSLTKCMCSIASPLSSHRWQSLPCPLASQPTNSIKYPLFGRLWMWSLHMGKR